MAVAVEEVTVMASPSSCVWCGSPEVAPIVYGEPDDALREAASRGEIAIGGCVVEDGADVRCRDCGARFGDGADDGEVVSVDRPWRRSIAAPFEVLGSGELPVVVHVPHAGLHVPADVRAGIVLDDDDLAREQRAITDHRTDVLAAGAIGVGARAFVNRLSRLVVDPERFPDPEQEGMAAVGMGAVYTATTYQHPLRNPTDAERDDLVARFFTPYADKLADLVDGMLERHGRCVVVDLHSYPARRLDYELGGDERPELCVGVDEAQTPEALARLVEEAAADLGIATARNTPFAGTYVPLRHLDDPRVTSVMLELRRDLHLDDETARAFPTGGWVTPDRAAEERLIALVRAVVLGAGAGVVPHD